MDVQTYGLKFSRVLQDIVPFGAAAQKGGGVEGGRDNGRNCYIKR